MGKSKKKQKIKNNSSNILLSKHVIEYLLKFNKTNGLIIGTNAVLRNLQKNNLAAVFFNCDKGGTPIYRSLLFWCKETAVPLLKLQEEDRNLLGSEFPVSITYGIKNDCMHLHPRLEEKLNQIKPINNQTLVSNVTSNINVNKSKGNLIESAPIKKVEKAFSCHKKHASKVKVLKRKIDTQADFLALCSSSDSEEEFVASKLYRSNNSEEFPVYKSAKWKDSDLSVK